MVVQPGLCRTSSETPKTGFLTTRLISNKDIINSSCDLLYPSERVEFGAVGGGGGGTVYVLC